MGRGVTTSRTTPKPHPAMTPSSTMMPPMTLVSTFFTQASQLALFHVQVFLLGIGFSSFQLFPFSMLPDTIEYDEMKSGMRREGIFSGVWASGQKMAYSVGPGIMGFALALSGFDASGPQGANVATGIRIAFCLLPAAALLLSYIPFGAYDLTEERFEEIKRTIAGKVVQEIAERRRFLDRLVTTLVPSHSAAVADYEKSMRQRNRLLEDNADPLWLNALESEMAAHAAAVHFARADAGTHLQAMIAASLEDSAFPAAQLALTPLFDGGGFFEGPRWRNGRWWVSDFYRQQVSTIAPDGTESVVVEVEHQPSGLGWLPDGSLLISSMKDHLLLRGSGATLSVHADLSDYCGGHLNDLVVDRHGNAFAGNFGFDLMGGADPAPANLVHVGPDGSVRVAADGLLFPNGSVITPDGATRTDPSGPCPLNTSPSPRDRTRTRMTASA